MKSFAHINAASIDEAVNELKRNGRKASLIAGGTDLIGALKDDIWINPPDILVNIKTIPNMRYIREDNEGLKIGALTTLTDISESPVIIDQYRSLAQAANLTASPLIRNLGTIAGNICQENRCWYYRYPSKLGGRIDCVRKGGDKCLAVVGDHRYHSIFGMVNKCIAVNPSDTAPALIALDSSIKTTEQTIRAEEFFSAKLGKQSTILQPHEIVLEIIIPRTDSGSRSSFHKIALRKTIDFAIVNCAVSLTIKGHAVARVRICLNGVYNNPQRATEAEQLLVGSPITEAQALKAGEAALAVARPLKGNRYKVKMAKTIIHDCILDCLDKQIQA